MRSTIFKATIRRPLLSRYSWKVDKIVKNDVERHYRKDTGLFEQGHALSYDLFNLVMEEAGVFRKRWLGVASRLLFLPLALSNVSLLIWVWRRRKAKSVWQLFLWSHKSFILPPLSYKGEIWTLLKLGAASLEIFERKVLHQIFGLVHVGDNFRIRTTKESYDLLTDMDVVQHINIQRLRWLGHVVRFDTGISRRPCLHWGDQRMKIISRSGVLK